MTDITELAQSHELLIANGQQTADLLRHLADNEIDSDYFAVVSECESYGKETDAELSITEFALRAAGYVDALVEALEKAQQRIAELEDAEQKLCAANVTLDARAELAERQLAEMALAAMDSEPVAWRYRYHNGLAQSNWKYVDSESECNSAPNYQVQSLYLHAQQVPVVPDEVTDEYCPALVKYDVTEVDEAWARGFNACRSAMLQAGDAVRDLSTPVDPQVAEYEQNVMQAGNSPVIPDTWIPVSERMPENKPGSYEYLVFEKLNNRVNHDYWNVPDAGDDTFTPFWNHYGEYVTHWMPLPAAPQEVNGE